MRAAKSADLKYDQLAALWAKGTFHPVYLLAGPDTLLKEEALKNFQKLFLAGDDSGLNIDRFDGDTSAASEILGAFRTLAFLGGRRLIVVRRAQELSSAEANLLADGLAAPSENALVLLWDEKADNLNVLVQSVKSAGVVCTFWAPFENQMPAWIQDRAKSFGKGMSFDAARALLDAVGPSLPELAQELDKLSLYARDKKNIELSDVEALRPDNPALQFLEFDRAFWRKDVPEFLHLMEIRRAQGDPPEVLISHMVRIYRKLFFSKTLLAEKKVSREDVASQVMRIRTRQPQEDFMTALNGFSWEDLLEGLESLLKADRDLKTGRLDPDTGLTALAYRLLMRGNGN
jgi:DNA polymerase III subunit delta